MGARPVFAVIFAVLSILIYFKLQAVFEIPPKPNLGEKWWGPGESAKEDSTIRPFKINVSEEVLKDLQNRLSNSLPFQQPLENVKHHYGMNTNLLKVITDFWKTKYNWREREKFLNKYSQFKTNIQGLDIHYLQVKPANTKGVKVLPLLMIHGWPGSVREFYEILPILTTPQTGRDFVFEVIAPSLPGYGFSEPTSKPGLSAHEMGVIFKNLMKRLGYEKFYIQGGDWGAVIVQSMATLFPENIIGVHSNLCLVNTPMANLKLILGNYFPFFVTNNKEEEAMMYPLSKTFSVLLLEMGYMHLQSTKPDTIGVALRDSPVGLAAYILEKFTTWTHPDWKDLEDGGLTKKYTYEKLLDNVMIYWITRSMTTSMRLYSETFNKATVSLNIDAIPIQVPSACARFIHELAYTPDSLLKEKYLQLVQTANYDGGHFAAFEVPDVLAQDVITFVGKVEHLIRK